MNHYNKNSALGFTFLKQVIFKTIVVLISSVILFAQNLNAQCNQPNAQFEFPNGETQFCEGAVVRIDNKSDEENNPACIDFMTLDWGDDDIDTLRNYLDQVHTYDISDSLACEATFPVQIEIKLRVHYFDGRTNAITKEIVIFPKPVASFAVPSPVCVGTGPTCFDNSSCWDSLWNWQVIPLGNTGGGTASYTEELPCHEFSDTGSYRVTLIASNFCPVDNSLQSDTTEQIVNTISLPIADAEVISGDVDLTADPFIVCLGSGNSAVTLDLDGDSLSMFENQYEWGDLRRYRGDVVYVTDPPSNDRTPNVPDLSITFSDTGYFEIILEVDNNCMEPDFDTLRFRVLSGEVLQLNNQQDACLSLDYTPDPFFPNATYRINNVIQNNFPVTLSVGIYNIEAFLPNICGNQTRLDSFEVFDREIVSILFPTDTSVCIDSDTLLIPYTNIGGTWDGEHLIFRGDSVLFVPETIGPFTLTYRKGAGDCEDEKSITITVEGVSPEAEDYEVCSSSSSFVLTANPNGGAWSSTVCPTCIRGDTFDIQEMLALGFDSVPVDYNIANGIGCAGSASITVSIENPLASFTIDSSFCLGDPILVDDSDAIGNLIWCVDSVIVSGPPFNSLSAGTHEIKLIAEAGDCSDTLIREIVVITPPPAVNFIANPLSGCADLLVSLSNQTGSFDNPVFTWYLNDSIFSLERDPDPILLRGGLADTTYTIRLEAGNGCNGQSASETIIVSPQPTPSFGPMQDGYCSGDTVTFANNSFGSPMNSWLWDYGNGITSTDSLPLSMIYFTDSIPQVYTISLTATNDCGTATFSYDLTINPTDVNAFFNVDPIEVCVGEDICLTNLSTPGATLLWDFGDGNTSILSNPCHAYRQAGVYTINLKAFGCGFDSIEFEVKVNPLPDASWDAPLIVCLGDPVVFENNSSGASGYLWDFGDGDTSQVFAPVHRYDSAGVYTVRFQVRSLDGCLRDSSRSIEVLSLPVADFVIGTDTICESTLVSFIDQSSASANSYLWDFGDGIQSTQKNPEHRYDSAGNYIVTLIVSTSSGCRDTTQQLLAVEVRPIADFEYVVNRDCSPVIVNFINTSIGAQTYSWDFGDTTTSIEASPIHTYTNGGTYTVSLEVSRGNCQSDTQQVISIRQTPRAEIIAPLEEEGCASFSVGFTNNSIGTDLSVRWDFGDSVFSFEENPTHLYDSVGQFEVELWVDDGFCQDSTTTLITVFEPVTATVSSIDNLCFGDEMGEIEIEVLTGTPNFAYQWSSGQVDPIITELPAGVYLYTVTDENNCRLQDSVIILEPDRIEAIVLDSMIVSCFGGNDGAIQLTANGGVPNYSFRVLDAPNGNLISDDSTLVNVEAGTYYFEVQDANGCLVNRPFMIYENDQIETVIQLDHISCFGFDDGQIHVNTIEGGVDPYRSVRLTNQRGYEEEGQSNPVFPNLEPGVYQLIILDSLGCAVEEELEVLEPDSIYISIRPEGETIKLGDSIWLLTDFIGDDPTFEWFPDNGLSDPTLSDPIARPFESTNYLVQMTDVTGCIAIDTINIGVDIFRNVAIPNAFTPNGDGLNDVFRVLTTAPAVTEVASFEVYDRWGSKLFEARDYDPRNPAENAFWDGKFRGKILTPGVYMYYALVKYIDGEEILFKGEVTLIR